MVKFLFRIIPIIICWGIFIYVILQIPYPETITQASIVQLLAFFLSLFLGLILSLNIILKNIFIAISIALGLIFALCLKALDSLNIITAALILISVGLLISYFRKMKRKNLTKLPKIPKLTHLRRKNE